MRYWCSGCAFEPVSDYWYLFIAREGDTYGYVISLDQKNYSKDDMIALSKTVRLLGEAGNGL